MKTFSSLTAVIGLWLGVSFILWAIYRIVRRRDDARQTRMLQNAILLIDEAISLFETIRQPEAKTKPYGSGFVRQDEPDRDDVRTLLNGIEGNSPFFEKVNAEKKRIAHTFRAPDFQPLSEILQIRRDFWAASEVLLMDDIGGLGAELADAHSYETFRAEARSLLFANALESDGASADPVFLRLSFARREASQFLEEIKAAQQARREKSKLPKPSEIIATPLQIARAAVSGLGEVQYVFSDFVTTVQTLARSISAKGIGAAATELRRARSELPSQFASSFERAGGVAQAGGTQLKRHYEFLLEARELRARYAEFLAQTPDLTEKGRQFLARLEIERRAEQFRETSDSLLAFVRQQMVVAIAHMIAGLQVVQAKVTPPENKQLVLKPASPVRAETAAAIQDTGPIADVIPPLRALLPPPVAPSRGPSRRGPRPFPSRTDGKAAAENNPKDALQGLKRNAARSISGEAQGGRSSLLDRLSTVGDVGTEEALPTDAHQTMSRETPASAPPPAEGRRFRMFSGKKR